MSKDKAADYFARHKESPECHITSDGRVFHSIGTATGFANGLKDNAVTSYKRDAVESKGKSQKEQDDASTEESKVLALETLKNFDTATATYPEIKALAKALSLESPSQSQVDLVAAIEAKKVIINTEVKA